MTTVTTDKKPAEKPIVVMKRYELKYVLTAEQTERLRERLKGYMEVDKYGKTSIASLYYDTPDYLLIRRSIEKPLFKEKMRLRSYGVATDSSPVFLELKRKYNKIVYKHYVNMGVAVALDNGLVVPNVPDADKKSLTEISKEIKELAKLAREGGLPMEKLRGGTFTITNLGMYGIESFTPIINQPEVAILGVTTMEDRAVVRGGEIVIRPMMTLSLTFDHRVVDGSVAAEFLQRVKALLENPALMLA